MVADADTRAAVDAADPMTPLELSRVYLDRFCAGDLRGLATLLDPGFQFDGPRLSTSSAADYLEALSADPPEGLGWEELESVVEGGRVVLVYRLIRAGASTVMTQLFQVHGGCIVRSLLVFDSADLR